MTTPTPLYRIVDLTAFAGTPAGTELIEISTAGSGSFKLPLSTLSAISTGTFYVSPTGSDSNLGTSPAVAWQTIAKVNASTFQPGQSILFAGGQTFSDSIVCPSAGTPAAPITFGSYGGSRATISSGNSTGFSSTSQDGIIVRDLIFSGTASTNNGVLFTNALSTNIHLQNIQVINCDAIGYGQNGIYISGSNTNSGYDDIAVIGCTVKNCSTVATGVGCGGIFIQNFTGFGLANNLPSFNRVQIRNCITHDNAGCADTLWTGSGIIVGEVHQCLIEDCTSYNNGASSTGTISGGVGIWAFDSSNVIIDGCTSHSNSSGSLNDGDGFDLDEGCVNCTIQNCLSYDNFGCGYLIVGINESGSTHNDQSSIINCVSINDGGGASANNNTSILIHNSSTAGFLTNIKISGNKFYQSHANTNILRIDGTQAATITGNAVNNTFNTTLNINTIFCPAVPSVIFNGNTYMSPLGAHFTAFNVSINSVVYKDIQSWNAAAPTQEVGSALHSLAANVGNLYIGSNFLLASNLTTGDVTANWNNNGPTYFMSTGSSSDGSTISYFFIGRTPTIDTNPTPQFFFMAETGILGIGGRTASFPGLANSGTTLQCTLADGSNLAPFQTSKLLIDGTTGSTVDGGLFKTEVQSQGTDWMYGGVQFGNNTDTGSMAFAKTRGAAPATQVIVNANDVISEIDFYGSDGTGFKELASVVAQVDGTPGSGSMPGRLFFRTTASGSTTFRETMSIHADASVVTSPGALATTAVGGFLYIPTCAGTPTGVPTARTGTVPLIYDTTNNKLYVYNSGWKGGTNPGAFT